MAEPFIIRGEIDVATAPGLGAELLAHAVSTTGDLVLDCSEMTFLDSSGLRALVFVVRRLRQEGRNCSMTNVDEACRRPIEISGLASLFGLPDRV